MHFKFCFLFVLFGLQAMAQFDPPVGQPGCKAISKDSTILIDWAKACTVKRGWQQVTDTSLGKASAGDSNSAIGKAGVNGTLSLGDGGEAIMTFNSPLVNGPGFDFAVFENSFDDKFLELAFVEVSSDGINYFRFHAICNTDTTSQLNGFGETDATQINNLAGKYRANYGTPFDLEELKNKPGLNINSITHIKIIDVIGILNLLYASRDSRGYRINDPFPTPFPSGGFDLDAVGVIHNASSNGINLFEVKKVSAYPNPCNQILYLTGIEMNDLIQFVDITGKIYDIKSNDGMNVNTAMLPSGIYMVFYQNTPLTKIQILH